MGGYSMGTMARKMLLDLVFDIDRQHWNISHEKSSSATGRLVSLSGNEFILAYYCGLD